MSEQEYRDACAHKPGARLRLYGCAREVYGPEPVYVIDGRILPADTVGPGRLAREAALAALLRSEIHSITVVSADSADSAKVQSGDPKARARLLIRTRAAAAGDSTGRRRQGG